VRSAERLAAEQRNLAHLRVKKHGSSLVLSAAPVKGVQRHARFTQIAAAEWGLSFPLHTGRWEKTPFTGSLREIWETL